MKNIKSLIPAFKVLLVVSILLFSISCKKFLHEDQPGQLSNQSELTSAEDGEALIVGAYRSLASRTDGCGDWGNRIPQTLEFLTGEATTIDSHAELNRYRNDQVSGDLQDNFNAPWKNWYQGVHDCNFTISKLPEVSGMTDEAIKSGLGEARTLRAWFYFNIVRYWGDAVIDTTTFGTIEETERPRSSLKTIYDEVIIPDLEYAVNQSGLSDGRSTDGRITRDISKLILADVYLTCAGYPYQEVDTDPSKDWCVSGSWQQQTYPVNSASAKGFLQKAKSLLDGLYGKYPIGTYKDYHDPDMNNAGAAIFQIQYLANVSDMSSQIACSLPNLSHTSMFGDEYGTFVPTLEYYNSYAPTDKRAAERQFFFTEDHISKKYDPTEPEAPVFTHPHLFKYYDSVAIKSTSHSNLNWTLYRYSDVLLMLTEVNWSLRKLGESVTDNDIVKGINEVRTRAELPTYSASDVDLLAIMSERAYELIFENKMVFDQRRTRKALTDGNGKFGIEDFIGHRASNFQFNFSAKNLLSPIPGDEINNNGEAKQNFGFQPTN